MRCTDFGQWPVTAPIARSVAPSWRRLAPNQAEQAVDRSHEGDAHLAIKSKGTMFLLSAAPEPLSDALTL
jgi:hypothetical protein